MPGILQFFFGSSLVIRIVSIIVTITVVTGIIAGSIVIGVIMSRQVYGKE